tara:strand:+ start:322 stop:651 length:330 start_codon:yes stop_codon:yes gene_type:complete
MIGDYTITLQRREWPTKNGDWVFRQAGVKATIYVCPRIFAKGIVPDEITLSSPDPVFRRPGPAVDHVAVQARAVMLTARAARSHVRAVAAQTRANKLDALAADARLAAG